MIILKSVSKIYPGNSVALKGVNVHIKPKEFVSIVGRSGTGKTTLVRILTAEEPPTQGTVIIGGWDITHIKRSEVPILRRQIGVVFQDFKLLEKKTVFENIAFALQACGTSWRRAREIIPQVLKIVGLSGKEHRYPVQLSGGEQQRVAIAPALVPTKPSPMSSTKKRSTPSSARVTTANCARWSRRPCNPALTLTAATLCCRKWIAPSTVLRRPSAQCIAWLT